MRGWHVYAGLSHLVCEDGVAQSSRCRSVAAGNCDTEDIAAAIALRRHRPRDELSLSAAAMRRDDKTPGRLIGLWARQHLEQDLSIARLAAQARMSPRTLIRRFEQATGLAPGEWVSQARMTEACRLLEATKLPIEQVALQVSELTPAMGFGDDYLLDAVKRRDRIRILRRDADGG